MGAVTEECASELKLVTFSITWSAFTIFPLWILALRFSEQTWPLTLYRVYVQPRAGCLVFFAPNQMQLDRLISDHLSGFVWDVKSEIENS